MSQQPERCGSIRGVPVLLQLPGRGLSDAAGTRPGNVAAAGQCVSGPGAGGGRSDSKKRKRQTEHQPRPCLGAAEAGRNGGAPCEISR